MIQNISILLLAALLLAPLAGPPAALHAAGNAPVPASWRKISTSPGFTSDPAESPHGTTMSCTRKARLKLKN